MEVKLLKLDSIDYAFLNSNLFVELLTALKQKIIIRRKNVEKYQKKKFNLNKSFNFYNQG